MRTLSCISESCLCPIIILDKRTLKLKVCLSTIWGNSITLCVVMEIHRPRFFLFILFSYHEANHFCGINMKVWLKKIPQSTAHVQLSAFHRSQTLASICCGKNNAKQELILPSRKPMPFDFRLWSPAITGWAETQMPFPWVTLVWFVLTVRAEDLLAKRLVWRAVQAISPDS